MYKVRFKNSDSESMKKLYAELSPADAEVLKKATCSIEETIENYFNFVDKEIKKTREEAILDDAQFKEWERLMIEQRDETIEKTTSLGSLIIKQVD